MCSRRYPVRVTITDIAVIVLGVVLTTGLLAWAWDAYVSTYTTALRCGYKSFKAVTREAGYRAYFTVRHALRRRSR